MADELDLERGDPAAAEPETASSRRRRRRRETGGSGGSDGDGGSGRGGGSGNGGSQRSDSALVAQLDEVFAGLADAREAAQDDELATALREEAHKMAQGLVSATRFVPFLRYPLLVILGVLIPLLAFARVGRILVNRYVERRERIMREREFAQQQEPEPYTPEPEPMIS